ncbi:hypothetical protein DICVIV_09380 [Dictyocaulus viviparus]|uniref:Uncharacterized protein n=1 Tax=Dictyocaulus viviparus TaxID=29172 RepID=A0A0D8XJ48_DICVI|nr:hypothetical protein DICVIV_09380 [Dictyocaulus viviparus]
MTQSVSVPSAKFCTTPVSHLKKKSHIQHKNCALNASIEAGSEVRSAIEPEANLKVMLRTVAVPKRPTSLSEHQIEAESRQSGSDNGNSSVKSSMSESLCIETLLNDVVSEVTRAIPHIKESNTKPSSEPVVHDNLAVGLHHAPLLSFPTAEESNEIVSFFMTCFEMQG